MPIRAEYDQEADALYIRLAEGDVERTVEHDHAHFVDLDASGNVLGMEILRPRRSQQLGAVALRFGLLGRYPEIAHAVQGAVSSTAAPTIATVNLTSITAGMSAVAGATASYGLNRAEKVRVD